MNILKTSMLAAAITFGMGAAAAQAMESTTPDRSVGQTIDDACITASVKAKLLADERTKGFDINVDTVKGVVSLTGGADSQDAKEAAGKIAAQTKGVVSVHDNLVVAAAGSEARQDANTATASGEVREAADKTADSVDDAWITSKVKTQLLADSEVKGTGIEVDTKANVVTLTGTVASESVRSKAIEIATTTKGVKAVNADQLVVKSSS
jgi:osmotically-inducible protein OsmY